MQSRTLAEAARCAGPFEDASLDVEGRALVTLHAQVAIPSQRIPSLHHRRGLTGCILQVAIVNVYVPNDGPGSKRLPYKMKFLRALGTLLASLKRDGWSWRSGPVGCAFPRSALCVPCRLHGDSPGRHEHWAPSRGAPLTGRMAFDWFCTAWCSAFAGWAGRGLGPPLCPRGAVLKYAVRRGAGCNSRSRGG
jgi:hypothetical protein